MSTLLRYILLILFQHERYFVMWDILDTKLYSILSDPLYKSGSGSDV